LTLLQIQMTLLHIQLVLLHIQITLLHMNNVASDDQSLKIINHLNNKIRIAVRV
jgi:hypothetical protein